MKSVVSDEIATANIVYLSSIIGSAVYIQYTLCPPKRIPDIFDCNLKKDNVPDFNRERVMSVEYS